MYALKPLWFSLGESTANCIGMREQRKSFPPWFRFFNLASPFKYYSFIIQILLWASSDFHLPTSSLSLPHPSWKWINIVFSLPLIHLFKHFTMHLCFFKEIVNEILLYVKAHSVCLDLTQFQQLIDLLRKNPIKSTQSIGKGRNSIRASYKYLILSKLNVNNFTM